MPMPTNPTPHFSDRDQQLALIDALNRQLVKKNPMGQPVGEIPTFEDYFPDAKEVVYRYNGKLWRAPYLLNADGTATIGVGLEVARAFPALVASQAELLQRGIDDYYRPNSKPGDLAPVVRQIHADARGGPFGQVVVTFAGEDRVHPYLFEKGTCLVSGGRVVTCLGRTFIEDEHVTGIAVDILAKALQTELRAQGRELDYGTAMRVADRALAMAPTDGPRELPRLLKQLLATSTEVRK